jgi:hypothetical protein
MSYTKYVVLYCDNVTEGRQCSEVWSVGGIGKNFTVASVRSRARREGWKLLRHVENSPRDLCPLHEMFEGPNLPSRKPLGARS